MLSLKLLKQGFYIDSLPALLPESAEILIKTCGPLAETTATVVFTNTNDEDLEGEVVLPLPDGSTVCGYAVDLNGVLVDAVVVDKVVLY